jgi:hypothetical protein
MNTYDRAKLYEGRMTPRQRRRLVKKAGREPGAIVVRDNGMGFSPAKQGYRELVSFETSESARPVSGAPRP